ncbi:MAG: hypothetical protein AB7P21_25185 [Lautropia sp.]
MRLHRHASASHLGSLSIALLLGACGGGGGDSPTAVSASPPAAATPVAGQPSTTVTPAGGVLVIPPATTVAPATTVTTTTTPTPTPGQPTGAEAAAGGMLPLLMSVELAQFQRVYEAIDGQQVTTLNAKACASGGTVDVKPFDANDQPVARSDRALVTFSRCSYQESGYTITLDGLGVWGVSSASKSASGERVSMSSLMSAGLSFQAVGSAGSVTVKSPQQTGYSTLDVNASNTGAGEIVWMHPASSFATTQYTITIGGATSTLSVTGLSMRFTGGASGTGSYAVNAGSYVYASATVSGSGTFTPRTLSASSPIDAHRIARLIAAH